MCMYSAGPAPRETREEREQRKKAKANETLAHNCIKNEVTDLPKDFEKWAETLFDTVMFYHKNAPHDYTGYCPCGAAVPLKKARNKMRVECSGCKKKVILRHDIHTPYVSSDTVGVAYIQRTSAGWMQRLFCYYKSHKYYNPSADGGPHVKVRYQYYEDERAHLSPDGKYFEFHPNQQDRTKWIYGCGNMHGMGWGAWRTQDLRINTYPKNLGKLFKNSPFEYSQLVVAAKKLRVNPFFYLNTYFEYPKLELLIKAGLYTLADEICGYGGYYSSSSLCEIKKMLPKQIGIDTKRGLEEAVKFNLSYDQLVAFGRMRDWDIPISDSATRREAIDFMVNLNEVSDTDFEYSHISNQRLFKYYLEQKSRYKKLSDFYKDYRDYITDCIALDLNLNDTSIRTPKDLPHVHAWTSDMVTVQEHQVWNQPVIVKHDAYSKYVEWSDGNLQILMAKNCEEILAEGKALEHCVGRYCERVAKGESLILFIRRTAEPDKPFFTLEIKPDMQKLNIAQYRGYKNGDKRYKPDEYKANEIEVDAFVKKYERWFNRRSVKDFDPDNLIAKYYKAVRKSEDGRYISDWDRQTEYKIGEVLETDTDTNPDKIAEKGIHIASLEFAFNYGRHWSDVAILELEVNLNDVIVPDAKDQVRASRLKVLREVPISEQEALLAAAV